MNNGIYYLSTGARFQPSTVVSGIKDRVISPWRQVQKVTCQVGEKNGRLWPAAVSQACERSINVIRSAGIFGVPQVESCSSTGWWWIMNGEWWCKLVGWLVSQSVSQPGGHCYCGGGGVHTETNIFAPAKTGWQVGIRGRKFLKKGAKNGPNFSGAFVCCWEITSKAVNQCEMGVGHHLPENIP